MSTINKVILLGNVGGVEVKTFGENKKLVQVSLATSEGYKNSKGDWENKTEWHKLLFAIPSIVDKAETISKGDSIYVEGSISTNSWTTKEGEKRDSKEISCSVLKFFKRAEQDLNPTGGIKPLPKKSPVKLEADDDLPF